jgi:hypothetical protein
MAKDRKVIPFTGKYKRMPNAKNQEMRATAAVSIIFMMFLVMSFNFSMFEAKYFGQPKGSSEVLRGIASVPKAFEPQWKKNLSQVNKNMILETSRRPTAIENLNFGILEGKYSLKIEDGRVRNIEFSRAENVFPKALKNRGEFISDFASAFVVGFRSANRVGSEVEPTGVREIYKVMSEKGESIFEFHLDEQQRLVSLNIK